MACFVDWLSLYQTRIPGSLPVLGSEFRISTSLETGELIREQVVGFSHEGSFDTSLHVRSDGTTVSVSGNPSAFSRADNLFGLTSVRKAIDVVNLQVDSLGLPEFNSERTAEERRQGSTVVFRKSAQPKAMRDGVIILGEFDADNGRQSSRSDSALRDERARITRIDITENISTSGAVDFIRHLSTYVHHGKAGNLYPNGRTVDWGKGSRRIYHKYYDKAYDISLKIQGLQKQLRSQNRAIIEQHIAYLEKLKFWCEENGIVRRETTFKSTELIDRKMYFIESWGAETMSNVIRPYQFHKLMNIEETRFTGVSHFFQSKGFSVARSNKAEMIHTSWVNGGDIRALAGSRQSFDRYRNMLLLLGVDIKNPCDISRITLRVHRAEWKEVEPPSWYIMPGQDSGLINRAA